MKFAAYNTKQLAIDGIMEDFITVIGKQAFLLLLKRGTTQEWLTKRKDGVYGTSCNVGCRWLRDNVWLLMAGTVGINQPTNYLLENILFK